MQTNCCFHKNEPTHETSHSQNLFGSLLDNLDTETRARVLEQPYMKSPLVQATTPFAKIIQEELKTVSYYDARIGRFVRTVKGKGMARVGLMGAILSTGYIQIQFKNFKFVQSHLVCLWFIGKLPGTNEQMDHISGNRLDDRPENLRLVSAALNARNHKMHSDNTTGYTGVYLTVQGMPYTASVKVNGTNKHLGTFSSAKNAAEARQAWLTAHPELGYTARHGL